ncbi:NUDIX hydrolase [Myxosarcina sp. GI1]|uniref:NUDIX hydrolase n=1 Tax=Myxosarcina sp. GI1 TaxID=1541065 RepID=UPI00068C1F43|nr:NUDIX hydrolase [Myxosarcina sp. GI1]
MNYYSANNYKAIAAPISVAMAILYQNGKFLMQLRDNIPNIYYPGVWGLFGGHLEPEEAPNVGLKRELLEEINYSAERLKEFRCYQDSKIVRHIFHAPLSVDLSSLELNEGWDLDLVSIEDIRRGRCYSKRARQEKALGSIHQKILLDFLFEFKKDTSIFFS